MGRIILIEGTDCSGKETQSNLLMEKLKSEGLKVGKLAFPDYDSPTGKIIGGPYLGKSYICESWFDEGAVNVDGKVASLYYAADRLYHKELIIELLNKNDVLILDRYTISNMAHQGCKLSNKEDRIEMYKWLEELEFNLLGLPRPDGVIFLYMPEEVSEELKKSREEIPDEHEKSKEHLTNAENAYLELSQLYGFKKIDCSCDGKARSKESISEDVYNVVKDIIK